jgi:Fur family ferric uptake transcriptional regulator
MQPSLALVSVLKAKGLKLTAQRRTVMAAISRMKRHFEAEDLIDDLRARKQRISRATIYRTLPLLVQAGLVREVHSSDRHAHYERALLSDHHDHLVCTKCGTVKEFVDPRIEKLQLQVCAERGFEPLRHRMEILGVCRRCQRTAKRRKAKS